MAPTTPSPSPAEDPQKLVDLQDSAKQTSFIDELAKGHNLTPEERKMFEEKYKKAIDELTKKHEGKKDIIIAEISDILKTFKESLQHEKNDDDDITEFTSTNPDKEKEVDTEKKLGGKEIDEHIKQLSDKIEAKLNTPATTPPENPADKPPVGAPISKDLPALNIDPNLPDIPEFKNPKQKGWLVEFIINWLGTTGIGGWIRKFIMGYNTIEEMTDTMAAMKNIMSIKKESPISSIINLTHITEYDFRDILRKNPRLDFSNMRNVEAAFLGKHAEDPKLAKYHCIYNGIGDMAEKMGATESTGYDPIARFSELLVYSKKTEFAPDYTEDEVDTPAAVDVPQEKTEAEKLEERKQEVKTAGEADENLKKTQEELEKAKALPDSADKGAKVTEAETKVTEAELAVKNIVEASKTKVGEMLKQSEDELKDTILTLEQKEKAKETLKNKLKKDGDNKDLQSELATLEGEIKDLIIKKKALEEAIGKIKIESEKFQKDDKTTISAVEATKAAQETERLAGESIGIIEIEQTKKGNEDATKQKEEQELKEMNLVKDEFNELKKEIDETLYDDNRIDDIKSINVVSLRDRVKNFDEKYKDKKYYNLLVELKVLDTLEKVNKSLAKYDLIKAFKKKEQDIKNSGGKINYDRTFGFGDWIEIANNSTIEIDIERWGGDATFLTENSEIIKKEVSKGGFGGSLTEAVNVLKDNKDVLAKENGQFTGKKANSDGSKHLFKIEAAQSW